MKAIVILENAPDCELERAVVEGEDSEAISHAIQDVIDAWILSPGDVIRIVEAA